MFLISSTKHNHYKNIVEIGGNTVVFRRRLNYLENVNE